MKLKDNELKRVLFELTASQSGIEWWFDEELNVTQLMTVYTSLKLASAKIYTALQEFTEAEDE